MAKTISQRVGELADSVLEPAWAKLMQMSWPIRAAMLGIFVSLFTVWQFPSLAIWASASLAGPKPAASQPLGSASESADLAATRNHSPGQIRAELAPVLGNGLRTADLSDQTAWSLSQSIIALAGLPGVTLPERDRLIAQMESSRHGARFCWSELLHEDEQPCVYFISGWVLSAYAKLGKAVQPQDIDFVLSIQEPDGSWPMFEGSSSRYASTYATSWLMIGLGEQLKRNLIPPAQFEAVRAAIDRGGVWLVRNKETGEAKWKAFPGLRSSRTSWSLSGLAIHALALNHQAGVTPIYREWLNSLPAHAATLDNELTTYVEVQTDRGIRIDHFVQFLVPWTITGTVDSMAVDDPELRERGRRFIRQALANPAVTTAGSDERTWWQAELLIGLRNVEDSRISI